MGFIGLMGLTGLIKFKVKITKKVIGSTPITFSAFKSPTPAIGMLIFEC